MEKFEKDIITVENIIGDYKAVFSTEIKRTIIALAYSLPLSSLFVYLTITTTYKIGFGICGFFWVLALYATLDLFLKKYIKYRIITTKNFKIELDRLADKHEYIPARRYAPEKPNILIFNKYGEFIIPECVNFSSSKQFFMRETEFFHTSKIDDEFYLIMNKKHIISAYNTKFFELKNDT